MTTENVIQVVNGLLADPGTSSKEITALIEKAIGIVKEVEYAVAAENERLTQKPAPAVVVEAPLKKVQAPVNAVKQKVTE